MKPFEDFPDMNGTWPDRFCSALAKPVSDWPRGWRHFFVMTLPVSFWARWVIFLGVMAIMCLWYMLGSLRNYCKYLWR